MDEGPADLLAFMRSFRTSADESPLALLARHDALLNAGGPDVQVERGVHVGDLNGWRLTVDVHLPHASPSPVLLFLHGGAWVGGSPATHDRLAREFAARGFLTVSVDYPRAPRRRFPAGYDGCVRALGWVLDSAGHYGGDAGQLAVVGDSAGANLAAAVAVSAEGRAAPVRAAALLYGIYDFHTALPVLAPLLGGERADAQQYVLAESLAGLAEDPRLSPLHAASQLPPCWLGVGTDDPLLAESEALASELARAGRPHELYLAAGAPHSFLQMPFHPSCGPGLDSAATFLHHHLDAA